jgi:hypothetical protein
VTVKEVEFNSGPFKMAGQIEYPEGEAPFPVVLFIPGLPQHDRFGTAKGYPGYDNYFQPFAQVILEAGWAVFRFDKGGTGKSSSGLNIQADIVAAYRSLIIQKNVNREKIGVIAFQAGAAYFYRKAYEMQMSNKIHHASLISTGVNDQKIEGFDLPILIVAGDDRTLRSEVVLRKYSERTGRPTYVYEAVGASEHLCSNTNPSLFKENGCKIHDGAIKAVSEWYTKMRDY